jgi:4-amino-4-deoxy-L-arabinose transferase-like glycosyltransferase
VPAPDPPTDLLVVVPRTPAPPHPPRRTPPAPRPPVPGGRAAGAHRRARAPSAAAEWLFAGLVVLVALAARSVGLTRANDLFIDELTYAELASMLAAGRLPALFGVPFFLHPPGGLLLDAAAIRLLGLRGTHMDLVFDLRWVHAGLGVVLVLLGYLVIRSVTTRTVAAAGGLVLALDPFVLRNDTRVMLETPMTTFLLGGLLGLLVALAQPPGRVRTLLEVCAGLLLGCAVFTKDMSAVPVAMLLVLGLLVRRTLPPGTVLRVAAVVPLPYVVHLAVVAQAGLLPAWWDAKTFGLRRMAGAEQVTGFNMPDAPSLVSRLIVQVSRFGTSYVLLAACLVVGVLAARSPHARRRLAGFLAVGAGMLGAYAAVAGTLEEQFGYVVVVSCVLAAACATRDVYERGRLRRALPVAAAVFVAATAVLGALERSVHDDGFRQVRAWLQTGLPPGTRVGLTGVTAEFALLPHPGYGVWPSLSSLGDNDAEFVMTQSRTLSQGYGYAAPELLTWLQAHARPVFTFTGPSNGATVVWELDRDAVRGAVADGVRLPPVTGGFP